MIDIQEEYIDVIEPVLCDKIKVQIKLRLKSPLQSSLRLYPNPASDAVFVIGDDDNMLHVYIYTMFGNLVAEHRLLSGESYPIGHLPSGTYIVRVVSETADQQSFRLIIQ